MNLCRTEYNSWGAVQMMHNWQRKKNNDEKWDVMAQFCRGIIVHRGKKIHFDSFRFGRQTQIEDVIDADIPDPMVKMVEEPSISDNQSRRVRARIARK